MGDKLVPGNGARSAQTTRAAETSPRRTVRVIGTQRRERLQAAVDAGHIRRVAAVELIEENRAPRGSNLTLPLFLFSLVVFASAAVATGNPMAMRFPGTAGATVLLIVTNIVVYALLLPVHEALHAAGFALQGGRPQFGAKMGGLVLYCSAPRQLFSKTGSVLTALAPLVVISLAGIVALVFAPTIGLYFMLGLAGVNAGASGDLYTVWSELRLPRGSLIEDSGSGYEAFVVEA